VPVLLKPDGDDWVAGFGGLLALEFGSGAPVLLCCAEVEGKGVCRRPVVRTSRGRPLAGAEQSGFVLVETLAQGEACATESADDDCGGAEDVGGAAAMEEFSPDGEAAADDGAAAGVRGEARWKSESRSDLARAVVPFSRLSVLPSGVTVLFACPGTACRAPAEEWAATAEGDDVFGAGTTVIGCGRCNASCRARASCAGVCVCAERLSASICARASLSVAVRSRSRASAASRACFCVASVAERRS